MNTVAQQDKITELRLKLKATIYNDSCFLNRFDVAIKEMIPTFTIHHSPVTNAIEIVIDRNTCSGIESFTHKKEFYMCKIADALMKAISAAHIKCQSCHEIAETGVIVDYLNYRRLGGSIYNLFDMTVILDNTIVVYL